MKLLFVVRALSAPGGGAEKVVSVVGSALVMRGHEVSIASFDPPSAADFHPVDAGVRRYRLQGATLRQLGAMRRLLRTIQPDAAIGVMYSAYAPLALAAIGSRVPLIASEHTAWAHYRVHARHAAMLRALVTRFAAVTIPSERVRDQYAGPIRRRMTVIPNPVVPAIAPRDLHSHGRRVVLAVGNLRDEKRHATLIEAFSRIAQENPEWILRIVGEGRLRRSLEEQVGMLGLTGRVELPGTLLDVASEYARADVFAMPSSYESFGLATAEALSAGVPAIGFANCSGTNELIADGMNGLLVDGTDRVGALAEGLETLMRSAELRQQLGQGGPASITRFSVDAVTDAWEDLLDRVTRRASLQRAHVSAG